MSFNLLDLVKDQVSGSLAEQASSFLGEDSSAVSSALGGIFPSILGGLLDKGSDESGAGQIMDLIKGVDSDMLGNIGGLFGGGASSVNGLLNSGGGIVDMIFGDKVGGIISMISKMSGLKNSSAGSLLKMAAPFLMGIIGKKVGGGGVSGLMDLLMGQKEHVAKALPSGMGDLLGLGGLLDLGSNALSAVGGGASKVVSGVSDAGKAAAGTAGDLGKAAASTAGNVGKAAVNTASDAASTGLGWIKWALPILAIAALAYFLMGDGCRSKVDNVTSSATEMTKDAAGAVAGATKDATGAVVDASKGAAGAVADATSNAADAVSEMASAAFSKVDEAARAALDKITFVTGSAGDKMMTFIKGGFKGDSNFRFNNLNFATGSAAIQGDSGKEVDNLAAILKAYPGVNVEIQGYTDNTGDPQKNVALSQARAKTVQDRLVAQGIDAGRISAKGYGDANPVGDNNTEAGRAENRRIEVSLVK